VTILPAGQALGVTQQLPVDDRHLYGERYMRTSLAVRVGGRAAELLVLGEGSTGAANDLAGATDLATRMVREYGLSPRLGPVGYSGGGPMYLGSEQVRSRVYAEQTQRIVDEEVSRLLREAEDHALDLLRRNRQALDGLTDLLLERETVGGPDVYDLVGRPYPGARDEPAAVVAPVGSGVAAIPAHPDDGTRRP
jgi:cell division protease FtsH